MIICYKDSLEEKKKKKEQERESIRLCGAFRKIFYLGTNEIY